MNNLKSATTTSLTMFDFCGREMAESLLRAWREQGLPDDFDDDKVQIMLNTHSGKVFLTNDECQVAIMNKGKLEIFYSTPYEGREGFYKDLKYEYNDMHPKDQEWFNESFPDHKQVKQTIPS